MNKAIVSGRLTRDPETTTTESGVEICKFSIASTRCIDSNGEEIVDFFDIEAWKGLATACGKYLKKGDKCWIEGQMIQNRWRNDEGQMRSRIVIRAINVEFMTKKQENSSNNQNPEPQRSHQQAPEPYTIEDNDDLPF